MEQFLDIGMFNSADVKFLMRPDISGDDYKRDMVVGDLFKRILLQKWTSQFRIGELRNVAVVFFAVLHCDDWLGYVGG